jgi:hypothetical protein
MDDVSDEIISQVCEEVEFAHNLTAVDDILLSQVCMDEEEDVHERAADVSEEIEASAQLGITHDELNSSLTQAVDCRDMLNDGGCGIITGWNYPSKQGNYRNTCFNLGRIIIRVYSQNKIT